MVLTPEIRDEWNRHQSGFARTWRVGMVARKRVEWLNSCSDEAMHAEIGGLPVSKTDREAMLKDLCLIEAAIATDETVASLDDAARRLFAAASSTVQALRDIVWVNPDRPEETPIEWVNDGAPSERKRKLADYAPE
jgi:hypothetical protein